MIGQDELPKASLFIRATKYSEGSHLSFKIASPAEKTKLGQRAIDVEGSEKGKLGLNKTNLEILVTALGSDETAWVGATFEVIVRETNNPKTNMKTLGFKILSASVKPVVA